ncbi:MAG: DUF177 domain-containing protein [Clostridia bacterium]|nr:DUF177 domain-containing protein [Clostridia bacterium]
MYLELDAIFHREGAGREFDYVFPLEDELIASDVHVKGSVVNKTGIVTLEAQADYTLSAVCARCGAPIGRPVEVPVRHTLVEPAGAPEDADDQDDEMIVVDGEKLDLDELIGEEVFLAMPYRFLCSEDCRGLCPQCGADLNLGPCACKPVIDPRWAALADLI